MRGRPSLISDQLFGGRSTPLERIACFKSTSRSYAMRDCRRQYLAHDAYHEMRTDSWAILLGALSVIAWAICIGAVILHIAGASSHVADVVALGVSVVVGLAWCVFVFVAEW